MADKGRVSQAMQARDEEQDNADNAVAVMRRQRKDVEERVRGAREWFDTVRPKHIDADQFIGLCFGALHRDADLVAAAYINPEPFMVAVSECARLGLVPGDTYHFVAFNSGAGPQITGIVDYRGEIDMIYRAGGQAVYCDVVRENDTFIWRRGEMELPHHVIHAATGDHLGDGKQIGLGDETERGALTGVYAYARLASGALSDVVVMSKSMVMKRRAVAKSTKFWGPAWPEEGPWTPEMWMKTALHVLYDVVPHSAEYLRELLSMAAVIDRHPITAGAAPALPPGNGGTALISAGNGGAAPPLGAQRTAGGGGGGSLAAPPRSSGPTRKTVNEAFNDMFGRAGITDSGDDLKVRLAIVTGLLAPEGAEITAYAVNPGKVPVPAMAAAANRLDQMMTEADAADQDVHAMLLGWAEEIAAAVQAAEDAAAGA